MDKYDLRFIYSMSMQLIGKLVVMYRENSLYKRYLIRKKEWLLMQYYIERNKRSAEYQRKHGMPRMPNAIHRVGLLGQYHDKGV